MKHILDKATVASFDVDAQNTFTPICPDELPVAEGHRIVDELNAQAHFAQYRVGSKDAHCPHAIWQSDSAHPVFSPIAGANVDVYWPSHAMTGTKGFELLAGLPPVTAYDFFVWKGVEPDMHPYGACFHDFAERMSTGVIEFLHAREVTWVIVGGLATDYCVKMTVLQLLNAQFQVIVNLAATRGVATASTEEAIRLMKSQGALFIASAHDLKG